MSRKRRSVSARDLEFQAEIEQQIQRLREMLALMAPETGSSALGATIRHPSPVRGNEALLMLPAPSPDAAANF
jgi:hypothetical protein